MEDKKFEKDFIDPEKIYLPKVMNPRLIDQGFVQSLVESMKQLGFLVDHPVGVFYSANLTCVETDLPYVCFSGMHRTSAAVIAKLDEIFCHVYTGSNDEFVEAMMMANFKYDPVQNSDLGQAFSQRDKRKACTRLLYMPKFFKMTNTALSDLWYVSEGSIRRWRGDVIESLAVSEKAEDVIGEVPETLKRVGVTYERLQELRDIEDSGARENAEGEAVQVRSKSLEWSEEEKKDFYRQLKEDAGWYNDGWLEETGIEDWDHVRHYIAEKFNVASDSYQIYKELSTAQLQQIQRWILMDDPAFIAGCMRFSGDEQEKKRLRDNLSQICDAIKKWLMGEFCQGGEYSDEFRQCKKVFTKSARAAGYDGFEVSVYDYDGRDDKDRLQQHIAVAQSVQVDVDSVINSDGATSLPDTAESFWVTDFVTTMWKKKEEKRETLVTEWFATRKALADALVAYPRTISTVAFCMAMDSHFYEKDGNFSKMFEKETISKAIHNDTLLKQISHFKKGIEGLNKDKDWVKLIPDEDVPPVMITSNLDSIPLDEIFEHLANRVVCLDGLFDENVVMAQLAELLGQVSKGQIGTQLYLLMKYALFISSRDDTEGATVEREIKSVDDLCSVYGFKDLSIAFGWDVPDPDPDSNEERTDLFIFDKYGEPGGTGGTGTRFSEACVPIRIWEELVNLSLRLAVDAGSEIYLTLPEQGNDKD